MKTEGEIRGKITIFTEEQKVLGVEIIDSVLGVVADNLRIDDEGLPSFFLRDTVH